MLDNSRDMVRPHQRAVDPDEDHNLEVAHQDHARDNDAILIDQVHDRDHDRDNQWEDVIDHVLLQDHILPQDRL